MIAGAAALTCLISTSALAHRVYVTNEKDDTVSVIDTETNEVVDTFEVGERPRGILFSRDFTKLYICASDSDTVQVWDVATGKKLHDLPSGEDPEQFALHPDDKHLYIANEDDAIATVVDVESRSVVAQIDVGVEPEGMAVSHDGKWAIVTSETTNMAHWIDTAAQKLAGNTLVDQRPRDAEFSADDSELWVTSEIGGNVAVIDTASKEVKHTISFAIKGISRDRIQPVGMELTKDGKYAFIALGPANHVAVVDRTKNYEVVDYILVGRRVWHMALTPEEDKFYTTNGISGDVTVVDVATLKAEKTIKVGRFPWGAAILPKDKIPQ
ncbi:MAG: YVTN family beta-propeller repeat protein [Brucellaceae bacterium]|nr:YVTN family beta-propeller repeat protein [Brucellaceae bacterium]